MLPLNNEATKRLLLEDDILSERGKLQAIWEMFTANLEYENTPNSAIKFITQSLENNVFNHLSLSDKSCMETANKFVQFVSDVIGKDNGSNAYTNFLVATGKSLLEYTSIKCDTISNTKINIDDTTLVSTKSESVIIEALMKNGLVDSTEIQSLLDDQYLDMVTTADKCIGLCRGELPLKDKSSDVWNQPLSLKDFGTDVEFIIGNAYKLLQNEETYFPCSPNDVERLLINTDDISTRDIYRRGSYIQDLANQRILSSTAKHITNLQQVDCASKVYFLSLLIDQLGQLIKQLGTTSVLLISYITVLTSLVMTLQDAGESEEILKVKALLAKALQDFNNIDSSTSDKLLNLSSIPKELDEYTKIDIDIYDNIIDDTFNDIDAAMMDIFNELDEIQEELTEGYNRYISINVDSGDSEISGVLSSLQESGFEQTSQESHMMKNRKLIESCMTEFHSELNKALLEDNMEIAANCIAKECALRDVILEGKISYCGSIEVNTSPLFESLVRDIQTYSERINLKSSGIDGYADSAKVYVLGLLE